MDRFHSPLPNSTCALMETTAIALHFVESYHAELWDSLSESVLRTSLPPGARVAQSSQKREVRSLCKVSIPDGWLPQLFLVLTTYSSQFLLDTATLDYCYKLQQYTAHKNYQREHNGKQYLYFG